MEMQIFSKKKKIEKRGLKKKEEQQKDYKHKNEPTRQKGCQTTNTGKPNKQIQNNTITTAQKQINVNT